MSIEKIRLFTCESVYWININTDIEILVKQSATYVEYQQMQTCKKIIPYEMLHKPWEVVGASIFTVKNNTLLSIIDYYKKFPVTKRQMAS